MAKDNIFEANLDLSNGSTLAETLLGNKKLVNKENQQTEIKKRKETLKEKNNIDANEYVINTEIKITGNQKKENKKYLNLSIRPDAIKKVKAIAEKAGISVSELFEQIIEKL